MSAFLHRAVRTPLRPQALILCGLTIPVVSFAPLWRIDGLQESFGAWVAWGLGTFFSLILVLSGTIESVVRRRANASPGQVLLAGLALPILAGAALRLIFGSGGGDHNRGATAGGLFALYLLFSAILILGGLIGFLVRRPSGERGEG